MRIATFEAKKENFKFKTSKRYSSRKSKLISFELLKNIKLLKTQKLIALQLTT